MKRHCEAGDDCKVESLDGTPCPRCGADYTVETWDGTGGIPASVLCAVCGLSWQVAT